jgi:hypothetical protein
VCKSEIDSPWLVQQRGCLPACAGVLTAPVLCRHLLSPQVGPFDRISIKGLTSLTPGKPLTVVGKRPDGTTYDFPVNHTFNDNQIVVGGGAGRGLHGVVAGCIKCCRQA